jgi:flagellar hook-associated protein 3 FlgL
MRIANSNVFEMTKSNLGKIAEQLTNANRAIVTGKKNSNLSDDPVNLTQALRIKSSLNNLEQLGRHINMGNNWLSASESALTHVQDLISNARALSVQMATATTGTAERASTAENVQGLMEEIISLADTEVNGRYIFAGSKTDTAPFDQSGTYNGDSNPFTIKISRETTVEVGSDGDTVFGTIFTTFTDLVNDLRNDNVAGIQDALTNLENHFNQISNKISEVGAKMLRMEIKEQIYLDLDLDGRERLSGIEDTDMAEAIINLQEIQLIYQAALASSSKIMKLSLVDYI